MKKRMVLSLVSAVISFSMISSTVFASVITTTSIKSLNNSAKIVNKNTKEELDSIYNSINYSSSQVNKDYGSEYQNTESDSTQDSWLLEHHIIDNNLDIESDGLKINTVERKSKLLTDDKVSKSDFLMALSKAAFGVQKSRPIVYKCKSEVQRELDKNGNVLDYSEGNYSTYQSNNVYEAYFLTLINKGIIGKDKFKNLQFINEFNSYGVNGHYPAWSNKLGTFKQYENTKETNYLGQGYKVSASSNFKVEEKENKDFFFSEDLSTMEALKFIESVLRLTEKDMTETESKIIAYKYGADYIFKFDKDMQTTISYLIAQGILNFENEDDYLKIFDDLKGDFFRQLIYRLANKSARLDFSKVHLTDNDNYLMKQGLYRKTVTFYEGVDSSVSGEVKQVDNVAYERPRTGLFDALVLKFFTPNKVKIKSLFQSTFEVTRRFNWNAKYTFDNKPIGGLKANEKLTSNVTVKSAPKEISKKIGNKETKAWEIVFKVTANSSTAAIAMVDNHIRIADSGGAVVAKVNTVAMVTEGKTTEIYLPKSELGNIGKDGNTSEIEAIGDKYLVNTKSGTRAVLLDNNKRALVGNQIIETNSNIVSGYNGEVYYNINIILGLMSNAYIDTLWTDKVFKSESSVLEHQDYVDMVNYADASKVGDESADHNVIDRTLHADIGKVRVDRHSKPGSKTTEKKFLSLLHPSRAMSVLYKNIKADVNVSNDVWMLVEWKYVMPGVDNSSAIQDLTNYYNAQNPSVRDMSNFLNTAPTDRTLKKWWDSNNEFSNAVCNYLYGTNGISYFNCGYMTPSLTILTTRDLSEAEKDSIINKLNVSDTFINKYCGGKSIRAGFFTNNGSNDTYEKLKESRRLEFLKGTKLTDDVVEYGDYVVDRTTAIYKSYGDTNANGSLNDDIDGMEKTMTCKTYKDSSGHRKYVILVVPRDSKEDDKSFSQKSNYMVDSQEYQYQDQLTVSDKVYMKFTQTKPLACTAALINGKLEVKVKGTNKSLLEHLNTNKEGCMQTTDFQYLLGRPPDVIGAKDSYYLSVNPHGRFDDKLSLTKYVNGQASATEFPAGKKEIEVTAYPSICLEKFSWTKTKDGDKEKAVMQKVSPFMYRENLMKVGIATGVIDSIVAKNYKYVSQTNLPENAKVIIGDMTFYNKFGKLVSAPISNSNVASKLRNSGASKEAIASAVGTMLRGMNVNLKLNGINQTADKWVGDYLNTDSTGKQNIEIAINPTKEPTSKPTLISSNSMLQVQKGNSVSPYKHGDYFEAFCISISFKDAIKFRPITSNSATYTLVYSVTADTDGALSKVPFFTGSLNYSWDDNIFNRMGSSKYKAANDFEGLMLKIKQAWEAANREEWKSVLIASLRYLLMYLIVAELVGTIMLKQPLIKGILQNIYNPTGSDSKGIDLLRIFTFGLHSCEDDGNLYRATGVMALLVIILGLTLKLH